MSDPQYHVSHPLWSRFLRWSTIRPKRRERTNSISSPIFAFDSDRDRSLELESLYDYEHTPLPDPQSFIRLVTLLPGKFEDHVRVRIHHETLRPRSEGKPRRMTLAEIRRDMPAGWEAFQTIIDNKYLFRNEQTGKIQWQHPDPHFHTDKYEVPPKDDGIVPKYETVSYVWGNPQKSAVVIVDGPEGPTKLRVTQSLIRALRYLRCLEVPRILWIDALCLNQSDYAELSRQVPRMHDIYKLAYKGTAWLGREDVGSTHALTTLQYLGDQVVAEGETGLLFSSPSAEEEKWFDPDFELPYSQDTWEAILTLLQRPWFNRLWVVQEIQPGAMVQCGHETIPLSAFTEAIYCLYSKARLPTDLRRYLEQATGTLARLPDPRDKIYGLLGLAPRKLAASMVVDYEKSNTAADVYAMVLLNHAQLTQRLEHFHNCFGGGQFTHNAPSWVPDWFSDIPGETYLPPQFAATTSRAHFSFSNTKNETGKPNTLRVRGVRCGVVSHVTQHLPPRLDSWEAIRRVRRWQPDDLDTSTYEPTGESTRRAYAITLICNALKEREPDWILSSVDEWEQQDFDQLLFGEQVRPQDVTEIQASCKLRSDVSDALQCCGDRLFFRTYEGFMGLAPADTQVGDVTAFFLGCSTPLILRPSKHSPWHFSIIGECFVHGLHDAIALLGPLPQPWTGIAAWVEGDRRCLRFLNTETHEVTKEDPRLEPLVEWERINKDVDGDDPILYDFFQHKETGEIINYDPRLEPDKLEAKGVMLDWFSLV
ncbi:Heterokaryon incompatibility protein 6,OR allele [Lachnellula subtilissima]|uniref:Heterokaryon incompatibility protein 6,OR allele n=1 Tax=Lachnellula subtilissima TaxID=602034 RepID=A0A8H8RH07_9HELO|nr:Heterokaryon incompatibility protein 6,OR allele [Lachnellula subtilissima]